jgi:HAD superfamily hydrolase (TIGR01549 family)
MTTPVVLFDLWRTLAYSDTPEPVWDLQGILGHRGGRPDDAFLRRCLTLDVPEPAAFLSRLALEFDRPITPATLSAFESLLDTERRTTRLYEDVEPVLEALRARGYRLGVISNAWPFSVPHIFGTLGLGRYFEHGVFSYAAGSRKPEAAIFMEACRRFEVTPEVCVMIGDNVDADVRGSVRLGMRAALIDRRARDRDAGPTTVPRLRSLFDVSAIVGGAARDVRSVAAG